MVTSASVVPVVGPLTAGGEPLALALQRLAAKAHAEGCAILPASRPPFGWQVQGSDPSAPPYTVLLGAKLHGCDCPGYARHQRCKHYALCLEAAGWLPDPPEDPPPAAPLQTLPRNDRRALAAADLATRFPSLHPSRAEDLAVA